MGAWGTGLYSDDVAHDVRYLYKELLMVGLSNEEATQKLIKDSQWLINDMYDGPVFWFVLEIGRASWTERVYLSVVCG